MKLEIISPETTLFSGEVELVTLPGMVGSFTVLNRHAPIVSVLQQGVLLYRINGKDKELTVSGGFVEVKNNTLSVCIDGLSEKK